MAEDPKAFLKRMSAARAAVNQKQFVRAQTRAHRLLSRGKPTRAFYYPACGSDFVRPLQHFSDRCDTFVFCDWGGGGAAQFVAAMKGMKADRPRRFPDDAPDFIQFPIDRGRVKELANMGHFLVKFFPELPPNLAAYLGNPPSSKGHYAELWIKPKHGRRRFVRVFWLAMEAVNLYWKLFARRGIAPRILCIKNWGHIGGEWTPFGNWQAHLGQTVRAGRVAPELLVARENDHDWPWTVQVDRFDDWDERPVLVLKRKSGTLNALQKPKEQPLLKGKRRDPWRKKYLKPGEAPRPKPTRLLLLEKLKADKK
jgi:hypothetical protein